MAQQSKRSAQTRKAAAPDSGRGKSQPKSEPQNKSQRMAEKIKIECRNREILGVIFIAAGLFLALTFLQWTGFVGEAINRFSFGLFGLLAYTVPVLFIAYGIFAIIMANKNYHTLKGVLIIGIVVSILSIVHVQSAEESIHSNYMPFVINAFKAGEASRTGGGLFGALLSYFTLYFIGKGGSYLLFVTLMLIQMLVLTNLSLQKTGKKMSKAIAENLGAMQERKELRRVEKDREAQERAEYYEREAMQEQSEDARQTGTQSMDLRSLSMQKELANDELVMPVQRGTRLNQKRVNGGKRRQKGIDMRMEADDAAATPVESISPKRDEGISVFPQKGRLAMKADTNSIPVDQYGQNGAPVAKEPRRGVSKDEAFDLLFDPFKPPKEADDEPVLTDVHAALSTDGDGSYGGGAAQDEAEAFDGTEYTVSQYAMEVFSDEPDSGAESGESDEQQHEEIETDADFGEAALYEQDFGEYERHLPPLPERHRGEKYEENAGRSPDASEEARSAVREDLFEKAAHKKGTEEPSGKTLLDGGPGAAGAKPVPAAPASKPAAPKRYCPPPISLLNKPQQPHGQRENPKDKARKLEETLKSFGIVARVTNITQGPVLTRFELQPAPGVRVNRITNLSDDIALSLAAPRVRIEAPIPGKAAIGIEIPNKVTTMVTLREAIDSKEFSRSPSKASVALGRDIAGKVVVADIAKMPHLLIAGSTGSGKSVCINTIICSFLYHASPEDVKLIMVDPKVVELAAFSNIPHLMIPVVTDPDRAAKALQWAVKEMVDRYKAFADTGVRELRRFNEVAKENGGEKLPQIIIIIDELADLMMIAPKDVEDAICRIAQMGRAAGIHLIIATQRPSSDVITGLIKANVPSRIAFAVASAINSRIILDDAGAEKLLGRGDMLFAPIGASQATRIQGCLVTDQEVERIRQYFEQTVDEETGFDENIMEEIDTFQTSGATKEAKAGKGSDDSAFDPLLPQIVEMFMSTGQASVSMIQRRMRVGYAKAGRLIDELESMGIVSPAEGSKARRVLISRAEFEQIFGRPPVVGDIGT